jgi:hypothetical protein
MIEIELDGTHRQVALRRERDTWIADIDGRTVERVRLKADTTPPT